jgi:hypothetical protein
MVEPDLNRGEKGFASAEGRGELELDRVSGGICPSLWKRALCAPN